MFDADVVVDAVAVDAADAFAYVVVVRLLWWVAVVVGVEVVAAYCY